MLKHLRNREGWSEKNLPQKGFTLVELLVVIVILGILAAVVIFAVGGQTTTAKQNSCAAEKSAVETALEAFNASTGSYPPAGAAGLASLQDSTNGTKFLRSNPVYWTIGANGTAVKTAKGTTDC